MQIYTGSGRYYPKRVLVITGFEDPLYDRSLLNLLMMFGEMDFFFKVDTFEGRYPNMAVVQYCKFSEARTALHAIMKHHSRKNLTVRQPWGTALSNLPPEMLPQQLILEDASRRNFVTIKHFRNFKITPNHILEFFRFGEIVSIEFSAGGVDSFAILEYQSPLSAMLAVVGHTNIYIHTMLMQLSASDEMHGLSFEKYYTKESMEVDTPTDIHSLHVNIRRSFDKLSRFLSPVRGYPETKWFSINRLPCLHLPIENEGKLSLRVKIKIDENDILESLEDSSETTMEETEMQLLDVHIRLDEAHTTSLEDKVLCISDYDGNNIADMRTFPNLGEVYDMVSVFELRIGTKRRFDIETETWEFIAVANIVQKNHLLYELMGCLDIFDNVQPDVFLATARIHSQVKRAAVELCNEINSENTNFASDADKHIIRVLTRLDAPKVFRVPIIATQFVSTN